MVSGRRFPVVHALGWSCGFALAVLAGGCADGTTESGPIAAGIVRLDASLADGTGNPTGVLRITKADGVRVWLLAGAVPVDSTVTSVGAYAFALHNGPQYRTLLRLTPAVTDTSLVFEAFGGHVVTPDTLLLARQGDLTSHPNPFSSQVKIQFSLASQVNVSMKVLKLDGTSVRVLAAQDYPAGANSVTWDGKNDAAATVPDGAYWIVLTTPDETRADLVIKAP
jgi:hypothetical protein